MTLHHRFDPATIPPPSPSQGPTPLGVILRLGLVFLLYAAAAIVLVVGLSGASPAQAQDEQAWIGRILDKPYYSPRQAYKHSTIEYVPETKYRAYLKVPEHYVRLDRPKQYWPKRAYHGADAERPDAWDRGTGRCRPTERGLGKESNSAESAYETAEANWMERVKWKWGIRFMDPAHAKDGRVVCARSGSGQRSGEKVAKAITKVIPFGLGKKLVGGDYLQQCEVVARPCSAPEIPIDEGKE